MAKKYEVIPLDSGFGFFVAGGSLNSMFIESKVDAELIAQALTMMEALKFRTTMRKLDGALDALQQLSKCFEGDEHHG